MNDFIYLDTNGTTPIAEEVQQVIADALQHAWGNVSSDSPLGVKARDCVNHARIQTAAMINAHSDDILFLSGGTEANSMVLNTFAHKHMDLKLGEGDEGPNLPHIITSTIEHPSIKKPLEFIAESGLAEVTYVEVDQTSHAVCVADVMRAVKPNTVLVSIMLANNETGNIKNGSVWQ